MTELPIPRETLAELAAGSEAFGGVAVTAVHCRHTRRVVVMVLESGRVRDLRWTAPMTPDEAEVFMSRLGCVARGAGLGGYDGPTSH